MQKTVVLNVVGLTPKLLGQYMPNLLHWAEQGKMTAIQPAFPAVTSTVQTTYLTGKRPSEHGIVANGWYFRDRCEIKFWRQANPLVQVPKLWDRAKTKDPSFTCANLFWWYNMYSTANYEVTPRPMYFADGRKIPDINTKPARLRSQLQTQLGQFPLFNFWGPNSSIISSQWIADAARWLEQQYDPTLTLIYLPHLDYCQQKIGPDVDAIAPELQAIDRLCGELIDAYQTRHAQVIVLSEYGIVPVNQPIHLNRILRQAGLLELREEQGRELLNAGASRAFAVADHQVAHIYINDPAALKQVRTLVESVPGVDQVLDAAGKQRYQIDHPRAGELVAIAAPNAWFTYYYWQDDNRAPDFARTVDIHRKPGFDPVELFLDPTLSLPALNVGRKLLQKRLGFRTLMDVIPLDATLVRGSHGRHSVQANEKPLLITQQSDRLKTEEIEATEVYSILWQHIFSEPPPPSEP